MTGLQGLLKGTSRDAPILHEELGGSFLARYSEKVVLE